MLALNPADEVFGNGEQPPWPRPARCVLDDHGLLQFMSALNDPEGGETVKIETRPAARPDPDVWRAFLRLADGSNERIRRFADKYGPLEKKRAGLAEDVALWRYYSRLAKAIATRAADAADREFLVEWCCGPEPAGLVARTKPREQREMYVYVAAALSRWLRAHCEVAVRWSGKYAQTSLVPTDLLGLIGLQLAHAIGGGRGRLEKCSCCGSVYLPERRATTGKRRYCDACREAGIPQKDATADLRERQKDARSRTE